MQASNRSWCTEEDPLNPADINHFNSPFLTMSVLRQAATFLTLGSQVYAFSLQTTYDSTNFLDKFQFRDVSAQCS